MAAGPWKCRTGVPINDLSCVKCRSCPSRHKCGLSHYSVSVCCCQDSIGILFPRRKKEVEWALSRRLATSATVPVLPPMGPAGGVIPGYLELIHDFPFAPYSSRRHNGAGRADPRHPHLRHLQAAVQQPGHLRRSQAERLPAAQRAWGRPQHRPVCGGGNGAGRAGADHQNHHLGDSDHHRYGRGVGGRSEWAVNQTPPWSL